VQALSAPDGFPLWTSDGEPGSVHDVTAARDTHWARCPPRRPRACRPGPTTATPVAVSVCTLRSHNHPAPQVLEADNRTDNALDCSRCSRHPITTPTYPQSGNGPIAPPRHSPCFRSEQPNTVAEYDGELHHATVPVRDWSA